MTNKAQLIQLVIFSIITGFANSISLAAPSDLVQFVDPLIGAGGHGHVFVGSSVPFGAIQPGPMNIHKGWDWCSGYHYSDTVLIGFSHLHLSGTGCADLGDILIMPYTGPLKTDKGSQDNPDTGYASRYNHQDETVRPDYYSLVLKDYGIKAELTATERVALHRYRFPADQTGRIMIDLQEGNGDRATETFIQKLDDYTIGGYRFSAGWARDQRVYFVARFETKIPQFAAFDGNQKLDGLSGKSNKMKGVVSFPAGPVPTEVQLKVAISPVSVENAIKNLETETPDWEFNDYINASRKKWNQQLRKIQFESTDEALMRTFYTAFYHTMICPVLFNDVNGDYRGTDKKVYTNAPFQNYSIFSLWDTYRSLHPLMTLVQQERVNDMIASMLAIYQQQGKLPVWHLMGNETDTMVGYHAVPPIVDAYLKGFRGFDANLAFEAMKASALRDERGLDQLKKRGYIPADKEWESVAKALEYAIDDACIALMADTLGKKEDAALFARRAAYYKNYFDKETTFMRGKLSDGSWRTPFDPVASKHREDDYCEGNAWQYTWLVPHDPEGLIGLFGSENAFISKLDLLFKISSNLNEGASADISGLIGQYAHGNEPSHHITYLYAFAGQQWKTAGKVREIVSTMYNDTHEGLCGNEDCGQMSAWYVLSALGFYPVHPANGIYVLGSPAMNQAAIPLPNGKTFRVKAIDNSPKNIYIQSATWNGRPWPKSYITHQMIMDGGELILTMGSRPNKEFGRAPADRPKSN